MNLVSLAVHCMFVIQKQAILLKSNTNTIVHKILSYIDVRSSVTVSPTEAIEL